MKKSFLLLASTCLILTACNFSPVKTQKVETNVYSLISEDEVIDFDKNPGMKISYQVRVGEELNPYFTIKDYFFMIEPFKKEGINFDIAEFWGTTTIQVGIGEDTAFVAQFNSYNKSVIKNGDFSTTLTTGRDLSKTSLNLRMNEKFEIVKSSEDIQFKYYDKMGFAPFSAGGKTYYPLSLLERVFAGASGINHIFNYNRIIQFKDNEDLMSKKYIINGKQTTSNQEMKAYIKNEFDNKMPEYLLKDRLASFNYIMEYEYGLKSVKKIDSMVDFFKNKDYFSNFLSDDPVKRYSAYYSIFETLDDGHTAPRDNMDFPWKENVSNKPIGPKVQQIYNTRDKLASLRTLTPGQVYYSSDNKLAFLSFDSFTFADEAFDSEGKEKETLSVYGSKDYDTFYYVASKLTEIRNKNTATDVVIDVSMNGGGTVGILLKLLPLFSKNNVGNLFLTTDNMAGLVQRYDVSCDSNGDKKYDNSDCFGNDFKFHILTSGYSFSCGNAFPYMLQKMGVASIIGQTSGGGECAVSEDYLPSGEHFYHSGQMHLGWFEDDKFIGDEAGAPVDKEIAYEDFYNLEKLQQIIAA